MGPQPERAAAEAEGAGSVNPQRPEDTRRVCRFEEEKNVTYSSRSPVEGVGRDTWS